MYTKFPCFKIFPLQKRDCLHILAHSFGIGLLLLMNSQALWNNCQQTVQTVNFLEGRTSFCTFFAVFQQTILCWLAGYRCRSTRTTSCVYNRIKIMITSSVTAQTHGQLNPKLCPFLIQNGAKSCRQVHSWLLSLLSLLSLMSQLSRCQMYFHTALLQLHTIVERFVLVCTFRWCLTHITDGVRIMARLTSGP